VATDAGALEQDPVQALARESAGAADGAAFDDRDQVSGDGL
jgi:hypothetical protein